jgi:hypothetical protein
MIERYSQKLAAGDEGHMRAQEVVINNKQDSNNDRAIRGVIHFPILCSILKQAQIFLQPFPFISSSAITQTSFFQTSPVCH